MEEVTIQPITGCLIGVSYPIRTDVWIYEWISQAWTRTGSLNQGRQQHGCVSLAGKGILVAGGVDTGLKISHSVEVYDPAKGTWSVQTNLPRDINPMHPVLLNWDDQVLALIDSEDKIYKRSEKTGRWSVLDGGRLPGSFMGNDNEKAVLVPGYWSC